MQQLSNGDVLANHYKVETLIGVGGFGTVYKGHHLGLDVPIAIKTLNLEHSAVQPSQMAEFYARFKREARSLALLRHPGIVQVYDFGLVGEATPYLVLDYFPGEPILTWGEKVKPTVKQWLVLFRQIFDALGHLHEKGLIHRDIKSDNVLVTGSAEDAKALLIDLGIAYSVGGPRMTQDGLLVGTEGCIDPELIENEARDFAPQSDFYAAGGLLYWALCGKEPFDPGPSPSPSARRRAIRGNRIRHPASLVPDMPEPLIGFLYKLLSTKQSERPPTAKACLEMIDKLLRDEDVDFDAVCAAHEPPNAPTLNIRAPKADASPDEASASPNDKAIVDDVLALQEGKRIEDSIAEDFERAKAHVQRVHPADQPAAPKLPAHPIDVPENLAGAGLDTQSLPRADKAPDQGGSPAQQKVARMKAVAGRMDLPLGERPLPAWRKHAVLAGAIVASVLVTLAVSRQASQSKQQTQAMPEARTYRPEDLEPKRDDSALAKFAPQKNASPALVSRDGSLDTFSPDVRAQYDGTIGTPPPAIPAGALSPSKRSGRSTQGKSPRELPPIDTTLAPVGAGEEKVAERSRPAIPHNTEARVRLLEALDTSSDEPTRAELEAPLVIGDTTILPAGSILSGRALLRYNRAQVRFEKATLPDGREQRIIAIAVTRDGREGIDGGRIEFGDGPEDKTGEKILRALGTVAGGAVSALPAGDVLSQATQTVAGQEVRDATQPDREAPRSKTRILLKRKTTFSVRFKSS